MDLCLNRLNVKKSSKFCPKNCLKFKMSFVELPPCSWRPRRRRPAAGEPAPPPDPPPPPRLPAHGERPQLGTRCSSSRWRIGGARGSRSPRPAAEGHSASETQGRSTLLTNPTWNDSASGTSQKRYRPGDRVNRTWIFKFLVAAWVQT